MSDEKWKALQEPFGADEIELLPRATGDKDKRTKQKCAECGGYHEFPCIHLSYVGHAGITMRLNDVDPEWTWEPMGRDERGLPALDAQGGLWAYLTILGVTKPAYGDPGLNWKNQSKAGTPDGMKEAIGDMLRNGAMRFGVGTQLWSKSDRAKNDLVRAGEDDDEEGTIGSDAPIVKAIYGKARALGIDAEHLSAGLIKNYGKEHPGDLTMDEAKTTADKLEAKIKERDAKSQGVTIGDEEIPF